MGMVEFPLYEYEQLEDGHIRILNLQAGEENDTVVVEISSEKLDVIKKYHALSWHWGSQAETETIKVKDNHNSDSESKIWKLPVKPNLLMALKNLRRVDKDVRLWVDAICIKQSSQNNVEKSEQISMMTQIYRMADEVSVWLGEEGVEGETAIKFIHKIVKLDDARHIAALDRNVFDETSARELDFLIRFLKREWFSRRWVVQVACKQTEIASARYAKVYCGKHSVDWNTLADAIALIEKNTTGMFRGRDKKQLRTWRYTLEELVSFLAAFKASRPHDTIYAILGLASDVTPVRIKEKNSPTANGGTAPEPTPWAEVGPRKKAFTMRAPDKDMDKFQVNYDVEPLVVFKRFLALAIKKSSSLDIICRPWAPEGGMDANYKYQKIELPSWITSLSRKPFQPTREGNMVRYNPDPLVGPATYRHQFYSASSKRPPEYEFADIENADSKQMLVGGFKLGQIGETWDSGEFGNVPADWLRAGKWEDETKPPPEELWRTLVADRNSQGDDPDRWYPMVFQEAVKERGIRYGFETNRLINETTNAPVAELFRRVQAVVWNRKLIRATDGAFKSWLMEKSEQKESEGVLGLAPNDAKVGDIICIIFGCSVPLVLRPHNPPKQEESPQKNTNGTSHHPEAELPQSEGSEDQSSTPTPSKAESDDDKTIYTLVGECYIDYMMDGYALGYLEESEEVESRKFIIEHLIIVQNRPERSLHNLQSIPARNRLTMEAEAGSPPIYRVFRDQHGIPQFEPKRGTQALKDALIYAFPTLETELQLMQAALRKFFDSERSTQFVCELPENNLQASLAKKRDVPVSPVQIAKASLRSWKVTGAQRTPSRPSSRASSRSHSRSRASSRAPSRAETPAQNLEPLVEATGGMMSTWILSNGQEVGRKKKQPYDPVKRRKVAENRGNACDKHRASKTTCDPDECPQNKLHLKVAEDSQKKKVLHSGPKTDTVPCDATQAERVPLPAEADLFWDAFEPDPLGLRAQNSELDFGDIASNNDSGYWTDSERIAPITWSSCGNYPAFPSPAALDGNIFPPEVQTTDNIAKCGAQKETHGHVFNTPEQRFGNSRTSHLLSPSHQDSPTPSDETPDQTYTALVPDALTQNSLEQGQSGEALMCSDDPFMGWASKKAHHLFDDYGWVLSHVENL
ncbi:hypothetical protein G7Y89_g8378 [Cudoniella acicularis]|uniref:Heterokaryon incompatibility domain-containing protein n=1 Tax=Cudoniella acicularis TaxID=354080 RepID=A0A8H4RHL0_9HELO|nr:hypothetical protein G7Y89_g8378 [Cudoniella acicularis]